MSLTPQAQLVLDYLQGGRALTNLVALTNLGIGSLTRRVTEIREAGHKVQDQWGEDHWGRRYKRYWMEVPNAQGQPVERKGPQGDLARHPKD